uniref:Uncharacterized protein n=1 Tax=Pithovirus LCPAC403 TaxID=2506596 RepID=A0A481ZD67_9VIRU|nr:MAG: uncharacterized protein LCPAC403_02240 [Pithovirus LCPAC403]
MSDLNVDRCELPEVDEKFKSLDQGKRSIFSLKTLHGFDFSEASSSLQKAIRRGHWKDALQWAVEMFHVPIQGKSNLFNRLYTISVEDVGIADPKQFYDVNELHKLYLEDKDNPIYAVTAAVSLAKAMKTRASDWSCHVFRHSQSDVKNYDPEKLINGLVKNFFDNKKGEILRYTSMLMGTSEEVKMKGIRYTIPIKIAITLIRKKIELTSDKQNYMNDVLDRAIDKIKSPSKNMKKPCRGGEGLLFFIYFANLHTFHVEYGYNDEVTADKTLLPLIEDVKNGEILGVPDYALDKHTRRGKKMRRGLKHFIEVSSKLNNEDPKWVKYSSFCLEKCKERMGV